MRFDTRTGAAWVLALSVGLGCQIPQDPHHTLDHVRGGTLRVGVTEHPPWVVRDGAEPAGVEPDLVRRFARSLNARVEWRWGPAAEHMEALEHYDLDVAIGGFTAANAWARHVGMTQPYLVSHVRVDRSTGTDAGLATVRHVMAVPPGENRMLMALEDALHDADVTDLPARHAGDRP